MMSKESFVVKLFNGIVGNMRNDYSDNYDEGRFGKEPPIKKKSLKARVFSSMQRKWLIVDDWLIDRFQRLDRYYDRMAQVYELLENDESKDLYVKLIAYRILGHRKVKLPLNTPEYKKRKEISDRFKTGDEFIETPFVGGRSIRLHKFDLSKLDIPLQVYTGGVYNLLFVNQYENGEVSIEKGDVLLDCGACWGETALVFAHKVGDSGHVYSFEFIPANLKVFEKNIALNENVSPRISIVRNALAEKSGNILKFSDNGPGSSVGNHEDNYVKVESITIDDFVEKFGLEKVDFIKMDIEGSELPSLKGAVNVLKRHKPKLAISIYHSLDDYVDIPLFLGSLNLGYRFFIKHGTIHSEETVLLAITK